MMECIRNIRRSDDPSRNTYAWLVRVRRKHHYVTKMFSDNMYEGKENALAAAIAYRNALITAAVPAEMNLWQRTRIRRNNTTGIPGVGFYKIKDGGAKWVAFWTDEHGKRKAKSFAVNTYGEHEAKQLAITLRQEQLARIFEFKRANP